MDWLSVHFPVSGVDTCVWVPPLVAFAVSAVTSMGGVSGAVLLLPFQVSVLGFTTPSVSATNFVYNLVAVPGGIRTYVKERRMAWPLAWIVAAGTLPGVLIGFLLRVRYLPDPRAFKLFVGGVLLCIGAWLLRGLFTRSRGGEGLPPGAVVRTDSVSLSRVVLGFLGDRFSFSTPGMFSLALVVGILGGTYGVGGGAIIAPVCVVVFGLPIHAVAGAALMGTFLTSLAGVLVYSVVPAGEGIPTRPDWLLGLLFGLGGLAGMHVGARIQRFVPARFIEAILVMVLLGVALQYIGGYFR